MDEQLVLAALSETERDQALKRFRLLQPFLEGQATLSAVARDHKIPLRTAQRWAGRYRQYGLAGLARRRRGDRRQHRMAPLLQQLIEGLALQKTRPTAASVHRQATETASQQGWKVPSYSSAYAIVRSLDPVLVKLAHHGTKAYQDSYDLLYRREVSHPNEIWQADHSPLDVWLLDDGGQRARPWLTIVEDDYSRAVAGYYLTFEHPSALNTSLALRQAIWRKADPHWPICGIPQIFYTDHGRDFTSLHMEQVAADLKMQLVFSTVGKPRGRGRIERFFRTVNQLFLHKQPGYAPGGGKPMTRPQLSLSALQKRFHCFLLDEYLPRRQQELQATPRKRWEAEGFLPQMPESLEQVDLLLLTSAKTRRVRRDGIHFYNLRYVDVTLAAYIGEDVIIRYDPRDMAEIRVYHQDSFICRAVCQELAGRVVPLKEIIRARRRRRKALREVIKSHEQLVKHYVGTELEVQEEVIEDEPTPTAPKRRLKRYRSE